jgi:uncharacterized peroxidase-related enzyme
MPIVDEDLATGETAALHEEIKRDLQSPIVPNLGTALGASPPALKIFWDMLASVDKNRTIPEALSTMISFTIAKTNNCQYCSAYNEFSCRQLGVDEDTLTALVQDLGSVNPQRVRAIIEFALKVAKHAKDLSLADYDMVREQGVSDEEIMEIILIAAVSSAIDIIADSMQVEVEGIIRETLEH